MTTTLDAEIVGAFVQAIPRAIADGLAAAGVAGLELADVAPAPVPAPSADATTVASPVGDGAALGTVLTVVPPVTLPDGASAEAVVDGLVAAAVAALAVASGRALEAAPWSEVDASAVAVPGGLGFAATLTPNGAEAILAHWVLDADLVAALVPAAPAQPAPAAAAQPAVAPASLPEFDAGVAPGPEREMRLLADVPMDVTVELGRATVRVRELLALQEGSIVELDTAAGAAVDVLVNGTLVARGDVVVLDDELGVRITEVVDRP